MGGLAFMIAMTVALLVAAVGSLAFIFVSPVAAVASCAAFVALLALTWWWFLRYG